MIGNPLESPYLLVLAVGGVSLAWLVGLRHPIILAVTGFALSVIVRTALYLLVILTPLPLTSRDLWIVLSALATVSALVLARTSRLFWLGLAAGVGLASIAFITKNLMNIGERFHEDSVAIIASSLVVFSEDEPSPAIKSGLAFPLMLSSGPAGELFTSFTPLVFVNLATIVVWTGWRLTKKLLSPSAFVILATLMLAVSWSTPMVRAQMFYINAHVLAALGIALIVAGFLMSVNTLTLGPPWSTMVLIGGVLASWARFEGMAIVLMALLPLIASPLISSRTHRLTVVISTTLPVASWAIWVSAVGGEVPLIETRNAWIIPLLVLAGATLWILPQLDSLRRHTVTIGFIALATIAVVFIGQNAVLLPLQVRNIFVGLGGWGFVAPAFLLLLVLIGLNNTTREYRHLLGMVAVAIVGAFVIKMLDGGGLGRQGFNDSINRSWTHWLPIFWLTATVGVAQLWPRARKRKNLLGKPGNAEVS